MFYMASYTSYSARMSPENTHKLMGFYMESSILSVILCMLPLRSNWIKIPCWRARAGRVCFCPPVSRSLRCGPGGRGSIGPRGGGKLCCCPGGRGSLGTRGWGNLCCCPGGRGSLDTRGWGNFSCYPGGRGSLDTRGWGNKGF